MVSTLYRRIAASLVSVAAVICLIAGSHLLIPEEAQVVEGEWTIGGGPIFSSIPTEEDGIVGFGAAAHVRYKFTDSIGITVGGLYSYHLPKPSNDPAEVDIPPIQVWIPRVGIIYVLDIIDIVPYFLVEATAYIGDAGFFGLDETRNVGAGAMVSIGADYRPWKSWSIGMEVGYHAFLMDISDYPVFINVNLHVNWHSDVF